MGYLQSQLNLMKTWSVLKGYATNNFFYYFLGLNLHFAQDKRVTKTQCNKENEKFYSFSFNIPVTKMVPWIKYHR